MCDLFGSIYGRRIVVTKSNTAERNTRNLNSKDTSSALAQWFRKCAPRIPRDLRTVPGDPWIHFCNGYFVVHLFFKLKE
jgi:hypothetical protein